MRSASKTRSTSALSPSEDLGKVLGVTDLRLSDVRACFCGARRPWLERSELAHGARVASGLERLPECSRSNRNR